MPEGRDVDDPSALCCQHSHLHLQWLDLIWTKRRSKITVREALWEAKTSRALKLLAILREHFMIAILATPRSERRTIPAEHDNLVTLVSILCTPGNPGRSRRSEGPQMR